MVMEKSKQAEYAIPPCKCAPLTIEATGPSAFIDCSEERINHPAHYNVGKIEVIEVIEDWGLNFCLGNAVKYIARARHKGRQLEDLQKAHWYLDREIKRMVEECKCTSF
jgi:hypothetical protein